VDVVDWKLEVVVLPVADLDRAKQFYADQVGFVVDVDTRMGENARVVQLTPPGSACSISFVTGLGDQDGLPPAPIKGLQLVVSDLAAARAHLVQHGVEASPIRHVDNGVWVDGPGGPWNSFLFFSDPDGNAWTVQEKPE
jgi:catechol 2,3-dioxygenase-like lactoylglutathione lyase family enzyme